MSGETAPELAIETHGLVRRYGKKRVLNGMDLHVPRGSVYGLLGKNGAGKSTTIRILMGLIRRHGGDVRVAGLDPARDDLGIKRRVGYVAENPDFYGWMRVEEIVRLVATYHDDWDWRLSDRLMKQFSLPPRAKVKTLSKGMAAKLGLLMALSFRPAMLILDEPMTGLDPGARREFIESILRDFQEEGKTIFVSSHLVNEIAGLVDRIGVMRGGRLMLEMPAEELFASVKAIRLTFEGDVPPDLACAGMLNKRVEGREAIVTVRDFKADATAAELRRFSPTDLTVADLTLEDIFIALLPSDEEV
jgi:ABC-2 type transport system ATP-binding protein